MNFLIIEDDDYKKNKVIDCLTEAFGNILCKYAKSVNSAVVLLESLEPDFIVLLDMSLPTYDLDDSSGGRPQGFGGIEILRNMEFFDLSNKVIIITQYESIPIGDVGDNEIDLAQIKDNLEQEFSDIFHDLVHFDVVSDTWKRKLVDSIIELSND
ncbi:hypothetical protein QNZ80_004268 [Vibrio parahaemolyticus]|nr:hypothetical protein [Vibrio parahaemolyticus]ELB2166862.1 hypothetical protein [Vibrio parahaemolyticus]ELB2189439.1 hypothetical protein [Vibrio parahaemolyticus]ELB2194551.1 hypothetical protein [Vibrio parahaemolyticus]ELB2211700.1 hypothetical protein [Vibrio parahaemolyticus]